MTPATHKGGPRLLAPAGSLAALEAVLFAGADAVYAGARGWSRERASAGLSPREAADAARRCRRAGARFQVALNTVPGSAEIPAFLAAAARLRDDGVETLVLNDPGAIVLVRNEVPGVRICASVGLSARNAGDAAFLREIGADAVVLPTDVPCGDVPAIKAAGGLSVEVFLHCRAEVILQGRCGLPGYVLSAAAPPERPDLARAGPPSSAKRSGRCGLVCGGLGGRRVPHSIEGELGPWIAAGVDAFKVQGRELAPEKIGALVGRLRKALDAAIGAAAGAARA